MSTRKYLCLTILGFRNPEWSEETYENHLNTVWAPKMGELFVKHGVKRYAISMSPRVVRDLPKEKFGWQKLAEYDSISQIIMDDLEQWIAIMNDPLSKEIHQQHGHFADLSKTTISLGWIQEFVDNGVEQEGLKLMA